jgi:phosphate uptake regulator
VVYPQREFDRQLQIIEAKVIELFAFVGEDMPVVTRALLSGSNEVADQLAEREQAIDALYHEIEQLACREILLQAVRNLPVLLAAVIPWPWAAGQGLRSDLVAARPDARTLT